MIEMLADDAKVMLKGQVTMHDFTTFHAVIQERIREPGAQYYPDLWWEKEKEAILANLDTSICFINEACTDEEFYFLSEIFDDIMKETKSADFLECIRTRTDQVENIQWRNEIAEDIEFAALYVE